MILRHAPILTLTPFSLFIVDSLAQPLQGPAAARQFRLSDNDQHSS